MAEVVVPAQTWETLIMTAANAIAQVRQRKSDIDAEVKEHAEDDGERPNDIL